MKNSVRSCKYDNIRAFLMFCVVFLHFLELFSGVEELYCVSEMFVMPAFVFLSGYFAKYRPGVFLKRLVFPYFLFQTLYIAFDRYVIDGGWSFQYTTPYWLLWYLPALACWGMLLPAIDTDRLERMAAVLLGTVALALAAGFDDSVGRYLTLSRVLFFLPYYVAGFYWRKLDVTVSPHLKGLAIGGAAFVAVALGCCALRMGLSREVYYGAVGYAASGGSVFTRGLLYAVGICCIFLIFRIIPNVHIPGLTAVGRHTMSVFLLHGFLIKLAGYWQIFHYTREKNLCLAIVLSLLILFGLGRDWRGVWSRFAVRAARENGE